MFYYYILGFSAYIYPPFGIVLQGMVDILKNSLTLKFISQWKMQCSLFLEGKSTCRNDFSQYNLIKFTYT